MRAWRTLRQLAPERPGERPGVGETAPLRRIRGAAAGAQAVFPVMAVRVVFVIPEGEAANSMIFARRQAESVRRQGVEVGMFLLESRTSPVALAREFRRFRREMRRPPAARGARAFRHDDGDVRCARGRPAAAGDHLSRQRPESRTWRQVALEPGTLLVAVGWPLAGGADRVRERFSAAALVVAAWRGNRARHRRRSFASSRPESAQQCWGAGAGWDGTDHERVVLFNAGQ